MAELSVLYLVFGLAALVAGLAVLGFALKGRGNADDPKATAMLIGGMMLATLGLLLTAFWVAFATGAPNPLNAEAAA